MAAPAAAPANNLGFLAVYQQFPGTERNAIEHQVWEELQFVHPQANAIHNFGFNYIVNLSRVSYNQLSLGLQDRIALNLWQANGANPAAGPNWGRIFAINNLP